MKKFEEATLEVVMFENDVITTSGICGFNNCDGYGWNYCPNNNK